jgi:hypothetical protein
MTGYADDGDDDAPSDDSDSDDYGGGWSDTERESIAGADDAKWRETMYDAVDSEVGRRQKERQSEAQFKKAAQHVESEMYRIGMEYIGREGVQSVIDSVKRDKGNLRDTFERLRTEIQASQLSDAEILERFAAGESIPGGRETVRRAQERYSRGERRGAGVTPKPRPAPAQSIDTSGMSDAQVIRAAQSGRNVSKTRLAKALEREAERGTSGRASRGRYV